MKQYLTEFIGTFFLVLVIALTGNPLAIGSMLMVMVYMGGPVSGAHYNPAVTIAVWLRGKIKMADALVYMVVQLTAAVAAAIFFYLIYGETKHFVPAPAEGINMLKPFAVEAVFTFALASVVLAVATSKKSSGNSYFGIAIGFTVMAAAYAGGGISGGAYNPAVGVGPLIADAVLQHGTGLKHAWLYIAGPCTGGIAAGLVYRLTNPEELRES